MRTSVISEHDLELLESSLDGELGPDEAEAVRQRLATEPMLAQELDRLRADRELRLEAMMSFEPDESALSRVVAGTRRHMRKSELRWSYLRRFGYGVAAAACIAGAFLAGAGLMGGFNRNNRVEAELYRVELRDESGQVIGVQKFKTLDKAREFSDDIRQWQQRQERLLQGEPPNRSAEF
jgi:anti-sigma factor RsiW